MFQPFIKSNHHPSLRIWNPYNNNSRDRQSVLSALEDKQLWQPSRHVQMKSSSSTTMTSSTTITSHMDLFNHDQTDQFLITTQYDQTNHQFDFDYDRIYNHASSYNYNHRVAIYDLWTTLENDNSNCSTQQQLPHPTANHTMTFNPIQEATFTTTTSSTSSSGSSSRNRNHMMTGVQWYPVDTGTFLTSTQSGYVTLWDTNHMIPVLNCQPYIHTTTVDSTTGSFLTNRGRTNRRPTTMDPIMQQHRQQLTYITSGSSGIATIHIGIQQPYLVASGSYRSDMTKIIDVRSGSTSHTLMIGTSTSFIYDRDQNNNSSNSTNDRCVTSVQWSPIQSYTVATCTNGNAYLWDIRSTIQPVAMCTMYENKNRRHNIGTNNNDNNNNDIADDPNVSYACHSMDSRWSQSRQQRNKNDRKSQNIANKQQTQQQQRQQQQHHERLYDGYIYHRIKFDYTGQYIIAVGRDGGGFRRPSSNNSSNDDSFLFVYDLLSYTKAPSTSTTTGTTPIYPKNVTHYSYTSPDAELHNYTQSNHENGSFIPPVMLLTGHQPEEQKIWVSAYPGKSLRSYRMKQDTSFLNNDNDVVDDDNPIDNLIGHMAYIRCGVVMTGPNRIRQRCNANNDTTTDTDTKNSWAPYTIITAAEDGVILVWEQQRQQRKPENTSMDDNDDANYKRNKRQRRSVDQPPQLSATTTISGDYDTW